MHLWLSESETALDYTLAAWEYIEQYGKPVSPHGDKRAVSHASNPENRNTAITQFGHVPYNTAIELIHTNSSEAKGRVERVDQTLQGRLIKEICPEGITGIEIADVQLPNFIEDFSRCFSRSSKLPKDLHRSVRESPDELRDTLAWHDVRIVSKSLVLQHNKILYLMDPTEENSRLAGEKTKVLNCPDGTFAFHYGHWISKHQAFDRLTCVNQGQIIDNKRLGIALRLTQVEQNERENEGKRGWSKKPPNYKVQVCVQKQLRATNPILIDPNLSAASLKWQN